jgi:hypothetical protein
VPELSSNQHADAHAMTAPRKLGPLRRRRDAMDEPTRRFVSRLLFGIGGALVTIGAVIIVVIPTWLMLPYALAGQQVPGRAVYWWLLLGGLAGLIPGVVLMVIATIFREDVEKLPEPERSKKLYGRCLAGIGFALLVDALITAVALAGFSWSLGTLPPHAMLQRQHAQQIAAATQRVAIERGPQGDIDGQGPPTATTRPDDRQDGFTLLKTVFGASKPESTTVMLFLMLSCGVAVMGALFYFATSLWAKIGKADLEPFDASLFWGGLWFRIGEALIFTAVLFLFVRVYANDRYLLLPLVALLVGMFLKSGERLIAGMANRLFAAFTQLFPSDTPTTPMLKHASVILPPGKGEAAEREVFDTVAKSVAKLGGVHKANAMWASRSIHVLYDPSVVTSERIEQEARLWGLAPQGEP